MDFLALRAGLSILMKSEPQKPAILELREISVCPGIAV